MSVSCVTLKHVVKALIDEEGKLERLGMRLCCGEYVSDKGFELKVVVIKHAYVELGQCLVELLKWSWVFLVTHFEEP